MFEETRGHELGHDKERNEPAPCEELERHVVPDGDKGEDYEKVSHVVFGSAQRGVQVSGVF